MKKIAKLLMILTVALFAACDDSIDTTELPLKVTPYNLEGAWRLSEWNGASLADSTYVYLVLDHKLAFEMYQNTGSMYSVLYTGTYKIEKDWRVGDIISGVYDYEQGKWNEYVITDFYKETMTWTAKDNAADVQKFVRVDEVPEDIVGAVRRKDD